MSGWWRAFGSATLLTVAALAPAAGAETETTAERWLRELAETRSLLLDERWAEAEAPSSRLLEELMADLKGGPGATDLVAVALAQLALCEAALDRKREALWHIRSAAIFNPSLVATELGEEFGEVGRRLDRWRSEGTISSTGPPPATGATIEGLEPPRIRSGNFIVLRASPEQLRQLDPAARVEFVIDETGLPVEPAIHGRLDNPAPLLLSLQLLLEEFSFEPARYRDEPVAVRWQLPLPLTRGALQRGLWELKRARIESLLRREDWRTALEEAEALHAALAGGSGPGNAEKQTIVAYYMSRARAGLDAAGSREP